ncbi:MAG: hypothetical protein HC938_15550 [Nitrospira sp.]|nr:hypothetical protein [Nitrospira sp.]
MSILEVIDEYVRRSTSAVFRLRSMTGQNDLMAAWRNGYLDRVGKIDSLSYEFHGSGVYIEDESFGIEIDFSLGSEPGGFDSWRLWQMIKSEPDVFKGFLNHADVSAALAGLLKSGAIESLGDSGLFTLAKAVRRND